MDKPDDVPEIPIEVVTERVDKLLLHALPQDTTLDQFNKISIKWMEIYEQVLEGTG